MNPHILSYFVDPAASGLLAVFLDVYNALPGYGGQLTPRPSPSPSRMSQANPQTPSRKPSSITSFNDVLTRNQVENSTAPRLSTRSRSPSSRANAATNSSTAPIIIIPRRPQQQIQSHERPSTPSVRTIDSKTISSPKRPPQQEINDEFTDFPTFSVAPRNPVTVEVKPLPKIRLDLLPVPREEDEEEDSSISAADVKQKRKSKHHSRHKRRSSKNHHKQ